MLHKRILGILLSIGLLSSIITGEIMVSATELTGDSARAVTVVENQERSQVKRRELEMDTVPEVIGTELAK